MPDDSANFETIVFLNGASAEPAPSAGAVKAFLAAHPQIEPDLCVIAVRKPSDADFLRSLLPQTPTRHFVATDFPQLETLLEIVAAKYRPTLAIFPPGLFGAEMAARSAARWRGTAVIGAASFERGEKISAQKSVYSQNLQAVFELTQAPFCLALAKEWLARREPPKVVPPLAAPESAASSAEEAFFSAPSENPPRLLAFELRERKKTSDLAEAKRLLIAGLGLEDKEGVALLSETAAALGCPWGVSRPVAMNAWADLDKLVGVSGAMTSPDWCLTVGVSGAAALLAGVESSRRLASVNTDPEAPIVARSDLAIVGEAKETLKELLLLLRQKNRPKS
ncbi:MAG: FAD-binding protein [Deltaproteobacteria bacterium]|nr:FAD-binding protein [Deltaproteobacteria bacterium]